ncbi:MAG: sugar nucleotide-binding protein [Galbitalea sp.]
MINTLGLIKHHIDDADSRDRETAVRVNALFPYELASIAERQGFRVLQIVTDCVYSGSRGGYTEDDKHDATDVYGQTKSLGEVPSAAVLKLRCSVIGPEHSSQVNLMAWVLSHADGTAFNGYTDHIWNGLTTLAFARMIEGIIVSDNPISGTVHVEPRGSISKYELARLILSAYGRTEVEVLPVDTGARVDRTIATLHPEINDRLWRDAGYSAIPTIEELVRELARAAGHTLDGDDA